MSHERTLSMAAQTKSGRARSALAWGVAFFFVAQGAFLLAINLWRPEIRDPEFGTKINRLRALQAAHPGRPLLVVMGSSRTAVGFQPDAVSIARTESLPRPLTFNLGLTGAGPILELLSLRRLLAEGIRPDWLVVEVLPPLLCQQTAFREEGWLNVPRLGWHDLPLWRRYAVQPGRIYRKWGEALLSAWSTHRFSLVSQFAPTWLPWESRQDVWRGMDSSGWLPYPHPTVTATEREKGLKVAYGTYEPAFRRFAIADEADRAMRELLELARANRIPTILLLMPEGKRFQAWYPSTANGDIAEYMDRLYSEYHVPTVDARSWMPDDAFVDSHHLLPGAAAEFTKLLSVRALQPLVHGRLDREARLKGRLLSRLQEPGVERVGE